MASYLRGIFWWIAFFGWSLIWIALSLPFSIAPGRIKAFGAFHNPRIWGRGAIRLTGSRFEISGLEKLPDGPFIVAANHTSWMDVFALFATIPRRGVFGAKKSLFWIPLFGWIMWSWGHIPLTRQDRGKDKRQIERLLARMNRDRLSVFWFPEGTRSKDGKLCHLKKGIYHFARQTGLPVVPIAIKGAFDVLPKGAIRVTPGEIRLCVLDFVYADNNAAKDERIRESSEKFLAELRERLERGLFESAGSCSEGGSIPLSKPV
ncbi:MAG: 1-acyl-sn-glycerol-3-phosphate acyltransferase [Planctomycetes bacterium]|nr:1-acyl-sn-glycerol-3-phosphate acyltransferase [Planctomycetota bacterium]